MLLILGLINHFCRWHVVLLEGAGINMLYILEYLRMLKYHTELYYVKNSFHQTTVIIYFLYLILCYFIIFS